MTFRANFSNPFPPENEKFGVITGTFALSRLPDIPGKLFALKAYSSNSQPIFIGNNPATSAVRMPWSIDPGEILGWFSGDNLNQYYMKGNSGSLYMSYWVQG